MRFRMRTTRTTALLLALTAAELTMPLWAQDPADHRLSQLKVRVLPERTTICPMDSLDARIELTNTSSSDLVVTVGTGDARGFARMEACPEGTAVPPHPPASAYNFGYGFHCVVLKPGESVTSPVIWKKGYERSPTLACGRYQLYARYHQPFEQRLVSEDPQPSVVSGLSDPVPFEVRWCSEEARLAFERMNEANALYWNKEDDEALVKLSELIQTSPPCVRRAALEFQLLVAAKAKRCEVALEAMRTLWTTAETTPQREKCLGGMRDYVIRNGWDERIRGLVGTYESDRYGNIAEMGPHWRMPDSDRPHPVKQGTTGEQATPRVPDVQVKPDGRPASNGPSAEAPTPDRAPSPTPEGPPPAQRADPKRPYLSWVVAALALAGVAVGLLALRRRARR